MSDPTPQALTVPTMSVSSLNPKHSRSVSTNLSVPYLNQNQQSLAFGKLDSDYHVHSRILSPEGLGYLPVALKDQLDMIVTVEIDMTVEELDYMIKLLMLKRAQDIYRKVHARYPPHMVIVPRISLIPAPIHDLLNSLGTFHSKVTGVNYVTHPPEYPNRNIPTYWVVNNAIVRRFNQLMSRLQYQYTMRAFPHLIDVEDRPLMITELSNYDENIESVIVNSWTNEPRPSDALIRSVCEKIYLDDALITYANCKMTMTQEIQKQPTLAQYVGSYVLESNS